MRLDRQEGKKNLTLLVIISDFFQSVHAHKVFEGWTGWMDGWTGKKRFSKGFFSGTLWHFPYI